MTERELDMAKRLEDFINQSQDQHALLQAQMNQLQSLLAAKEEQLASATFRYNSRNQACRRHSPPALLSLFVCSSRRLGVIEEEKEEDERKLSVAVAAAERMSVLVRQTGSQNQTTAPATSEIQKEAAINMCS